MPIVHRSLDANRGSVNREGYKIPKPPGGAIPGKMYSYYLAL